MVDLPDYPSLVTAGGTGYVDFPTAHHGNPGPGPPLKNTDTNNPPAPLEPHGLGPEEPVDAPENIWNEWTAAPGGSWNQDLSLKTR